MAAMQLSHWLKERNGRGRVLAQAIGVPQSFVVRMASGDKAVPVQRCVLIEAATAGAVTRKDLRPADWADIWPEAAHEDWRPVGAAEPVAAGQV